MSCTLTITARAATDITLTKTGLTGGATDVEIQYGTREDFQFCIAPIVSAGLATPQNITGLNRDQIYYMRGRSVVGAVRGVWGPIVPVATLLGVVPADPTGVAIQPVLIIPPDPVAAFTIGALGAVNAGYPLSNLKARSPTAAARVQVGAGNTIIINAALSGRRVDTIAVLDTNLPEASTIQVGFGTSLANAEAGVSYQTAVLPFRASAGIAGRKGYHAFVRLAAAQEYPFASIKIIGAPPLGLVHLTHAVFGLARVGRNWSDLTDQPFDLGTIERQRDGSPDPVTGYRSRKVDFTVSAMTETQTETQFGDLPQKVGFTDHVLVVTNSKANLYLHDRLLFGTLTQNRGSGSNMRFERQFSVESIIN